jgi:hypothetical protein
MSETMLSGLALVGGMILIVVTTTQSNTTADAWAPANMLSPKPVVQRHTRPTASIAVQAAGRGNPWINLRDGRELPTAYNGATVSAQALNRNLTVPTALASADFDEDGVPDVVSGYMGPGGGLITLHRGNVDSIFPKTQDPRPKTQDHSSLTPLPPHPFTPSPFHPDARVFEVDESPDFIGAGDFDADGHWDVVTAARGSDALHFLRGTGKGELLLAQAIPLPGAVTAMVTGEINRRDGLDDVIVGVVGESGPQVLVFEGPEGAFGNDERGMQNDEYKRIEDGGLRIEDSKDASPSSIFYPPSSVVPVHHSSLIIHHSPEVLPMPAEVTALALGQLDDSFEMDLAVAAGSELLIVQGRDRRLSWDQAHQATVQPASIDQRSFSFTIRSLALGDFVWDEAHQTDIALLAEDGAVHLMRQPETVGDTRRGVPAAGEMKRSPGWPERNGAARSAEVGTAGEMKRSPGWPERNGAARSAEVGTTGQMRQSTGWPQRATRTASRSSRLSEWPSEVVAADAMPSATRLIRAKTSSLPTDDLIVLDSANHRLHIISDLRPQTPGLRPQTKSIRNPQSAILSADGAVVAVLPMRLNVDALNDLVILEEGSSTPTVALTAPMATVMVNSTTDVADGNTSSIVNLMATPGADGVISLREAITAANNTPGMDTIQFDLGSGTPSITLSSSLPTVTDAVTINGNTGGATRVEINLNNRGGLNITSGSSTVRALVINRVTASIFSVNDEIRLNTNGGNFIENCFLGTDATGTAALGGGGTGGGVRINNAPGNMIGGTMGAMTRNVISGLRSPSDGNVLISGSGATMNQVLGNYIGTDVTGTASVGNAFWGVRISNAPSNMIGGMASGARNVISGHRGLNVFISTGSMGNQVQGNFIGANVTGTAAPGNAGGVRIESASNNTIGGTMAAARNVISGNNGGVWIVSATNNQVQGNYIGTQMNGTSSLGNNGGVWIISSASNNTIGGTASGAGNIIAFNGGAGVLLYLNAGTGNAIRQNSIHDNTGLGIDLWPDGVTPNDPNPAACPADTDTGANNLQNFPVLTSATPGGGGTTIQGTLNSTANTTFTLEFFANDACDPSGFGEGKTFIGSTTVTTDGSCNAGFTAILPVAVSVGQVITATATDPNGNTSEFSQCRTVAPSNRAPVARCKNVSVTAGSSCTATASIDNGSSDPDGDPITLSQSPPGPYPLGTTTVTLTVSDNKGASSQCTGTVTVVDTTPPVPDLASLPTVTGQCSATVTAPTAHDNCAGLITATTADPTSYTSQGTFTVHWTFNDGNGNTSSQTQTVIVKDTTLPMIIKGSIAACYPTAATAEAAAIAATTATDNCPGAITKTATTSGDCAAIITITATDGSGNMASVQYSTRIDSTPPQITCPASTVVGCTSPAGAVVMFTATAADTCDPQPTVICTPASGSTFPLGATTVTCTATDACGNRTSCSFTVAVRDTMPPMISCPANLSVLNDPNQAGAVVHFAVTATDTCDATPTIVCTPPSGSVFPAGVTTPVTCTATDDTGNQASCGFTVKVTPTALACLATTDFQSGGTGESQSLSEAAEPSAGTRGLLLADFANDQVRVLLSRGDGTFQSGPHIPVGDGPHAIALGDFNQDGRTDAVVANELSNDLSMLLGNGDGTFQRQRLIPAGNQPTALGVGDFNGDGRLDLAVASFGENRLLVLIGQGDGSFRSGRPAVVGIGPVGIAVSDFDGDGRLDLAVCNFDSNDVTVLHGAGDGSFTRVGTVSVDQGPMTIVAGDFQGDGRPELAAISFTSNTLTVLKAGGRAGFEVERRLSVGQGPVALVAARLLTGRPGVAVANLLSGEVSVRPGDASGELRELQRYSVVPAPVSITPGDFNNDGRVDLAVLDADGVTLRVLLDPGDGTARLVLAGGR